MSRDYKRTGKSGGGGGGLSGVAGFFAGLAVGLGVAMAVYLHGQKPSEELPSKPVADKKATPRSARQNDDNNGGENPEDTGAKKYDFYDMLPKFEVVVPERENAASNGGGPVQIDKPGAYVLQAGSYRNFADADRMRAKLALQGLESKIQKVTVDSDTWHRIRIGPISDLEELNRTRALLRQINIEAMVIRVGE